MSQNEDYTAYAVEINEIEGINTLFRKVYKHMAFGLILTAITAYFTASSYIMLSILLSSKYVFIALALAEIGLVAYLSSAIEKISPLLAFIVFYSYSILNGITLSVVLLVYTGESVYVAFLSTAGMFGAMSVYGLYTKRDLTSMGGFLQMGLFGLVAAMLINMFVRSSAAQLSISIMGVIVFLALTAYDTVFIKVRLYEFLEADEELTDKAAIIGALELYLDFINLFLHFLRIFGVKRD